MRPQAIRVGGCRAMRGALKAVQHGDHIAWCLGVARDAVAVPAHGGLAGVVGGQREAQVAVEHLQQALEMARAAAQVLARIERVRHAPVARRRRHQLHQPHRAGARDRARVVAGLDRHDGMQQRGREPVFARRLVDEPLERLAARGRLLRRRQRVIGRGVAQEQAIAGPGRDVRQRRRAVARRGDVDVGPCRQPEGREQQRRHATCWLHVAKSRQRPQAQQYIQERISPRAGGT